MRNIGIDVGGTNTDAVLVDGDKILGAYKAETTQDVITGVQNALNELIKIQPDLAKKPDAVMIGTTHFINAVVQRKHINKVGIIRICLPSCASLKPLCDWPKDLAALVDGGIYMVRGGHEYDGQEIVPLDELAIAAAAREFKKQGIQNIAVTSVFSPMIRLSEERALDIIMQEFPEANVTLSASLGRIGLLERENVAILNASLLDLAAVTIQAFQKALSKNHIDAPLFLTLNDGTVTAVANALKFPVFSFASGPTNSMRGAAFLSKIDDGMVCDVGGTTSDIGCLKNGFPREANSIVKVGGVRTLFRMPDLLSIGIGGGTIVEQSPLKIGPSSVGYRLPQDALIFGGNIITCSDIAVAAGISSFGDASKVKHLTKNFIDAALENIHAQISESVDRMKTDNSDVPLLAVGGGAMLVPERVEGISKVVRVENYDVANAVGAAVARISGEVDKIYHDLSREEALKLALDEASANAIDAGANPNNLELIDQETLPLAYLQGHALRIRCRVVGEVG